MQDNDWICPQQLSINHTIPTYKLAGLKCMRPGAAQPVDVATLVTVQNPSPVVRGMPLTPLPSYISVFGY